MMFRESFVDGVYENVCVDVDVYGNVCVYFVVCEKVCVDGVYQTFVLMLFMETFVLMLCL
jgi:hypothetical protein